jgi:AraC-like DNA-binding protein
MTTRDRPQHIKRVLDLIEADPAVDHSVVDLATAVGGAPRTLQKRFQRTLGKTPRAFMREARLARARQELLGAAAGASVTEIATRCGFTHLGRFAVEHRAHYGEPPSSTLQRRRASIPGKLVFMPMRGRPTVAVMPSAEIGTSHRLALGIAEELAVALSRVRSICLVAPAAARFQLYGSVRGDGRRLRATFAVR